MPCATKIATPSGTSVPVEDSPLSSSVVVVDVVLAVVVGVVVAALVDGSGDVTVIGPASEESSAPVPDVSASSPPGDAAQPSTASEIASEDRAEAIEASVTRARLRSQ
jgi:hypothetical protein